jgi:BMFP domain-containing protein YqiC
MQSDNPLLADFVKLVNSAAGTFAGIGREAGETVRERAREMFSGMDFVSREEFDAVKDLAAAAREEVETLKARIDALEKAARGA